MPAALIIAGVGTAIAAAGTVATISAQNKAAKAQASQFAYEKQINQNRSAQERRSAIRTARMTTGALVQAGANQGAENTSALAGGLGSIGSQLDTNLSFLDTQQSLAGRAGDAVSEARTASSQGAKWGAVSSLGMAIFNNSSTIANKVFPASKAVSK